MNRVFLTGGTGFIGREVVQLLASQRSQVGLFVRDIEKAKSITKEHSRVEFFAGDLFDRPSVSSAIASFRPDTLIHLGWAGVTGPDRNNTIQFQNHIATIHLVEAAIQGGVSTIVGLGSQAEYGLKEGIIKESDVGDPLSLYGACKLSSYLISKQLCQIAKIRFAWLRLFSCYGPADTPSFMIPMVIETLLNGECPALTEARQLWDYLYVSDAAAAIVKVADSALAFGLMNLGSGVAVPIRRVVEQLRDFIDRDLPLGFGQVPHSPNAIMHLQADITKLEKTGWRPLTTLDKGLKQTVMWHRNRKTNESN